MNVTLCPAWARCWRDVTSSAMSQDEGLATEQIRASSVHLPLLPGTDDPGFPCLRVSAVVGTGDALTAISGFAAAPPTPVAPPWFAGPGRRTLLQT